MTDERPWREITPSDYRRTSFRLTRWAQDAILQARNAGEFRLRLVLRESENLKKKLKRRRDPLYVHDYNFGPTNIAWEADELVIERCDGQRYRIDRTTSPWAAISLEATPF